MSIATPIPTGLPLALSIAGGRPALARALGLTRRAVNLWVVIPRYHLADVARVTGLTRAQLRPDLFAVAA